MSRFPKVPKPEFQEPIDWTKWMNNLIDLDSWIAKYRKQHEEKYGKNTR